MENKKKIQERFLPYSRQNLDKNDIEAVKKVLKSNFLTQGPQIQEFEKSFARYVNSKYAVACATGTAALHMACISLNIKKEDNLVTTPITFVASANCGEFLGAKTFFSDIDSKNFCIDPIDLEKILKKRKINLVVVVHMSGHSADMKKIYHLKKKYGFKLIEDSCHALGGKYKDKRVGSCFYSDISTFSFHPVKPITTGEGGMITTNSETIYRKLLKLRTHGIHKNSKEFSNKSMAFDKNGKRNIWYYEMSELGYNYRITDIQAALGKSQLKKINKFFKARNKIAKLYNKGFSKNSLIQIPEVSTDVKHAYHLYTILINFKKLKKTKNEVMMNLKRLNIGTQVLYIPVHLQPYYKKKYKYKFGDFPKSEKFYDNCLSIPIFYGMKKKEVNFVIKKINDIVKI